MKKMKLWLSLSTFVVVLAACNDSDADTSTEGEDVENEAETEVDTDENATEEEATEADGEAEEVMRLSYEAMESLESYRGVMDIAQTISFDGEEMPMDSKIEMDVMMDPMMFAQTITTPDPMTGEEVEIEQYMDEDGILYMFEPMIDEWMKMDLLGDDLMSIEDLEMSPQEQLEILEQFTENITLSDEGDQYALSVEGSGDDLIEFSKEIVATQQNDEMMAEQMEQLFNEMTINTFDYVMYINKDTYYQEGIEMNFEMEMTEEGETISINQQMNGTFSDFDGIDTIDIPEEAIENAVDIEEFQAEMEAQMEAEFEDMEPEEEADEEESDD
ncbi:DUF6612 family protein [Geomicrobium sediminis]|uniref:Uncharacterized protein n=1 Tax=Geomicrobium sediminis TaxID=1347788 RepID=A0ABS2PEE6_9BACL|nr:DUF6612 family protein [Geomicrobium sediminis]MBM7633193.1 hypothetical protein [Geomicrobium sediminis]